MDQFDFPFRHFIKKDFFEPTSREALIKFTSKIKWEFFSDPSFPQYISPRDSVEEFFLCNSTTASLFKRFLFGPFIEKLEQLTSESLDQCCNISFHKLSKGCLNVVHNDSNEHGEKVRLIAYLSNPSEYQGGELNLYKRTNLSNPAKSYKLDSNSVFLFSMDESSFHSVSKVLEGERICLVMTYK